MKAKLDRVFLLHLWPSGDEEHARRMRVVEGHDIQLASALPYLHACGGLCVESGRG
jgi:hypothetical protein